MEANREGNMEIEEDYRFHYLIILASYNSMYEEIFDFISPYFLEAMNITKRQSKQISERYFKASHEEHKRILLALKAKNSEEARICMLVHLKNNEEKLWSNQLEI